MFSGKILSNCKQRKLIRAIRNAEIKTSGEIRIHIEKSCPSDPVERAKEVFEELNMHTTAQKNGVLFYISKTDKKFAVIGDEGINKVVPENFWDTVKNTVTEELGKGKILKGLKIGIAQAGAKLSEFFPYTADDRNELTDQISIYEN